MPSANPARSGLRRHIVEVAYRLFKRDGFHATGIDRIIAEAGVAKMTMYRHFPSKDDLIVAVLDHRAERFAARLRDLGDARTAPAQQIESLLDGYERWFRAADFHGCLFAHALAEYGDAAHPVFAAVRRQKDDLARWLRRALEPAMPADRAEAASSALLMLIEGATLMAELGRADEAVRALRRAAARLLATPEVRP